MLQPSGGDAPVRPKRPFIPAYNEQIDDTKINETLLCLAERNFAQAAVSLLM